MAQRRSDSNADTPTPTQKRGGNRALGRDESDSYSSPSYHAPPPPRCPPTHTHTHTHPYTHTQVYTPLQAAGPLKPMQYQRSPLADSGGGGRAGGARPPFEIPKRVFKRDPPKKTFAPAAWFPPGTPVSSTRKLISSSFHRLDMTLAVAEALNPNKPINQTCGARGSRCMPPPPPPFPQILDPPLITHPDKHRHTTTPTRLTRVSDPSQSGWCAW